MEQLVVIGLSVALGAVLNFYFFVKDRTEFSRNDNPLFVTLVSLT